ncbi:MAG: hypothetical protein RMJ98_15145 [Myxococcales bacterium]|nr:hypothetical protein [Polyangiaceae bacterium]MDW8250629.1 hypothetical protein [Myxococcales bacterium]
MRFVRPGVLGVVLMMGAAGLGACSAGSAEPAGAGAGESSGAGGKVSFDIFRAPAVDDGGLVNISGDLLAVLEGGELAGACERYWKGAKDRRSRLLCGKSMFFYESFGTAGVPAVIPKFLVENFPEEIGPGFSKLGMIADPTSKAKLPLGMVPTTPLGGTVEALAFSCASCHFGRLPDGRYAVGAPNHAYQYGKHNLAMALFPMLATPLGNAKDQDPEAVAAIQPLLDRVKAEPALGQKLLMALLPLAGASGQVPPFPKEAQRHYARWKSGTMDFFIEPLPFNDRVHTVSKISALWAIPDPEEQTAAGMRHAMLGWTGGTSSLLNFVKEFVSLGGGKLADWPEERILPLVEYIYTLRSPDNLSPPPADQAERGAALFAEKGCLRCHGGPRGSGLDVYTYDEIGTDREMGRWSDPELSGEPCCNITFEPGDEITHGIKSPRLNGLWAFSRFLHNGSVDSLESLFCLVPRGSISEPAYGDGGHWYTCDGLDDEQKRDLIAFLRSH